MTVASELDEDFGLIDRILPPYANAAIRPGLLTVCIDSLGFAKVYRAKAGGLSAWSNSAMLTSLFCFGRANQSEDGWTALLAQEAFLGNSTPLAGVQLEEPRTFIRATDTPSGLQIERHDSLTPLFWAQAPEDVAAAIDAAVSNTYRSISALGVGPLTVPLSGGRDSRLLAAIGLKHGLIDEFWTSSPPELDVTLAKKLIDRLDREIPWSTRDRSAEAQRLDGEAVADGRTTADIWNRLEDYQAFAEGEGVVGLETRRPSLRHSVDGATLWGIGGEFARAFYYKQPATVMPALALQRFWAARQLAPPMVDPLVAQDLLEPRIRQMRDELSASGIGGLHQLDHYYVFQRVRRLQNRLGTTSGIRPYFSPAYLAATLSQTPLERVQTRYYETVINRAYPAWANLPYSHELYHANPEIASPLSQARAFWRSAFVGGLVDELEELIKSTSLLVPGEARKLLNSGPMADDLTKRMRQLGRLLNFFSYLRHLEGVRRSFDPADSAVQDGVAHEIPIAFTRRKRRPWSRAAVRLAAKLNFARERTKRLASRVVRGIRRIRDRRNMVRPDSRGED